MRARVTPASRLQENGADKKKASSSLLTVMQVIYRRLNTFRSDDAQCVRGGGEATWTAILQSRNGEVEVEVDRFRVWGVFPENNIQDDSGVFL